MRLMMGVAFYRSLEDHNWDQSSKPKKPLAFNNGENSALPEDPNVNTGSSSTPAASMDQINSPQTQAPDQREPVKPAGPGAVPVADQAGQELQGGKEGEERGEKEAKAGLRFFFSPELKKLIFPEEDLLEEGTDT